MQHETLSTSSHRLILLSPTGSGKTAAFLLWLARRLPSPDRRLRTLIIAPARELAQQVASVIRQLLPDYRVLTIYGGHPLKTEINSLAASTPDILIATPGRLLDHLQRHTVDLSTLKALIIDEMDKCLDLGFLPDIKRILKSIPRPAYLLMSSATMPSDPELLKLTGPMDILDFTSRDSDGHPNIEIVEIPSVEKDKLNTLENLLDSLPKGEKTIIFTNHRDSAERIFQRLKKDGFAAGLYHGGLEQDNRELALVALKNGSTPILVSTDLGARGLDIPEVDSIIHYHIPPSEDAFIHRNGRTARAGASGTAYVITNEADNIPEYIRFDREWNPSDQRSVDERRSDTATLVFNIGKKDKISRGDILGYFTKQINLPSSDIGKIDIGEHYATVAVPSRKVREILIASEGTRLKNKRFRLGCLD